MLGATSFFGLSKDDKILLGTNSTDLVVYEKACSGVEYAYNLTDNMCRVCYDKNPVDTYTFKDSCKLNERAIFLNWEVYPIWHLNTQGQFFFDIVIQLFDWVIGPSDITSLLIAF